MEKWKETKNAVEYKAKQEHEEDQKDLVALLKACTKQKDLASGSKIHALIVQRGLLLKNLHAGRTLVNMYAKCGALAKAHELLDELPVRGSVLWTSLLAGYSQYGYNEEALKCFKQMQCEGISPDMVTYVCILKACGAMEAVDKGEDIHMMIVKEELLSKNCLIGNALVDMYARCGALGKAEEVFGELPIRDIVTWTVMIAGYTQYGQGEKALDYYKGMQQDGFSPDAVTFASILKACSIIGTAEEGQKIHIELATKGLLKKEIILGTALVDMYAKCGMLSKVQEVFDDLPIRSLVTWNALITGYIQHGYGKEALTYFEQMKFEGLFPDPVTFVSVLKACGNIGAVDKGCKIHSILVTKGLVTNNLSIGSALVDMYAKLGVIAKAKEVFDELPIRNVVCWTALISGYAEQGCAEEAINSFESMLRDDFSPNGATFVCVLKACGSIRNLQKGQEVHAHILKDGLLKADIVVCNALIDMYVNCGALEKAFEVFNELPTRNIVSWNALIGGLAEQGHCREALLCLAMIKMDGLSPDAITIVCILKACGSIGAIDKGQEIHTEIARDRMIEKLTVVGNALLDMYVKCGVLAKAQELFEELPVRDALSWNILTAGSAQHGHFDDTLKYFERMKIEGVPADSTAFSTMFRACGGIGGLDKAQQIHILASKCGFLRTDNSVGNALLDLYTRCGEFSKAREVFDELLVKDIVSWTALISGYTQYGHEDEALNCFEQMENHGFLPDAITFLCTLKACGSIGAVDKGKAVHSEIVRRGLLEKHAVLGSSLVSMYAKCGAFVEAQKVLCGLAVKDLISWTALIAGYAEHGYGQEALKLFKWMQHEGLSPNTVTIVSVLRACGSIGACEEGERIHAEIAEAGLLAKDIVVGNVLVDMYARCGTVAEAQKVFDQLPAQDAVTWTALIAGYAEYGECGEALGCDEEALGYNEQMQLQSSKDTVNSGFLVSSIVAAETCTTRNIRESHLGLNRLTDKAPVLSRAKIVLELFNKMIREVKPDVVTFSVVLNACSNSGLLEEGQIYFDMMSADFGIFPTLEHYSSMIDLCARSGYFDKAIAMIKGMPIFANLETWHSLLGACQKWGNVKLGRLAFEYSIQLDEKHPAAYNCMRNIYAAAGMQEDADNIEVIYTIYKACSPLG